MRIYAKVPLSCKKFKALSPYENVEVIEIPFEGKTLPGYFVIPDNCPSDSLVMVFIPGAHNIYNMISSEDKEYKEYPGCVHCTDDQHEKVSSYAADWMMKRLQA